jgi:hypothetical protein
VTPATSRPQSAVLHNKLCHARERTPSARRRHHVISERLPSLFARVVLPEQSGPSIATTNFGVVTIRGRIALQQCDASAYLGKRRDL